ncbi:unnamed protein product [Pelagomonas calceolata]|uniref:Arylamine N-acetyltransferase n=1 Tax=Pelagomonas calceolata TaxID=35677 RepID=A0A8J2SJS0_9STRA|nr:unnamed protein product [Pelagomonas calceolata]
MSSLADAWCIDASDGDDLQFIGPLLLGQTKWLGAAMMRDGSLVGVPGHARQVLRVDPRLHRVTLLGRSRGQDVNRNGRNVFKWLRGVSVGDKAYGIPMHGDAVLKVTPRVHISKIELLDVEAPGDFKWHGGQLAPNGFIYGVPCYASRVLRIDPRTDEVSYFGDLGDAKAKWYGGILGPDGNMYCMPFAATRVLRVVTAEDRCELIGPELTGGGAHGGYKYHGGLLGPDNCVYGFPMNAKTVLRVNCLTGDVCELPLPEDEPFNGGKYKWGGGCVANGCVYGVPSDSCRVLKIDCRRGTVSLFGRLPKQKNKFQGGVLGGDGGIWCVPCDAAYACRIDPVTDEVAIVGTLPSQHDKYQGGYADGDGNVICIPECGRRVLKIRSGRGHEDAFVDAYLARLGLGREAPSLTYLARLVEHHLERIPFENVELVLGGTPDLSSRALRAKLLDRRRGGHCVELNGLFSELLAKLGFAVRLLACRVLAGPERGGTGAWRAVPSHAAMAVRLDDGDHFVDVGLGEPPLGPIPLVLGTAATTPDGLVHQITEVEGGNDWELQWLLDGAWAPRLRWRRADGPRFDHHAPSCGDFYAETERWRRQPLGRKLVVCKLTRTTKTSVVGAKLRITTPRVGGTVTVTELRTADAVRDALEAHFGIVCAETEGLVLRGDCDEEAYEHL